MSRWRIRRRYALTAASGLTAVVAVVALTRPAATTTATAADPVSVRPVAAAAAMPAFRLPFPCGQTWRGNSSASSAHTGYEIDFNRGSTPEADNGDTVVAAAAGKVIRSTRHVNESGFGNHVVIQHSGGYTTWYAHLKYRSVSVGQQVAAGQKIGAVGRTTRPSNSGMSSHLHYEVRLNGAYPPVAAYFGGRRFGYPQQTLTACAAPAAPSKVAEICGSGYKKIDEATLKKNGVTYGKVYLGYKDGTNCVITVKPKGARTAMAATLQVQGGTTRSDKGNFTYYAGPVKAAASGKCVKWGGTIGPASYTSPFEHCG
ncbi:M23 family metallopeptidase [Thermomonospora amylolytica]|uniref:M23 family metallopeptidase n=1 Tax=Thermomonospora amylolytica TaxID=1411117 RepID=UPI000E6D2FCE|nr:M23 family metallopeptidase [Thermomonospora amylolytica]